MSHPLFRACRAAIAAAASIAVLLVLPAASSAAQSQVGLGTAASFAVLAGTTVTNTGPSTINGNLGVHPGTAVSGFPPGTVNGSIHTADAVAQQAKTDLVTAYDDAASRGPAVTVAGDLGGLTVTNGVYRSASSLGLTGTLTLDAQGNADAVFIFQAGSTLTTAAGSRVNLVNGAQSCNVFWQVGSSATLGAGSTFTGSILALTSITLGDSVTLNGRALARNGAVTLNNDIIRTTSCANPSSGGGGGDGGDTDGGGTDGGGTDGGGTDGGTGGTGTGGGGTGGSGTGGGGTGTRGGVPAGTALLTTTPASIARHIATYGTTRCIRTRFTASVRGMAIRRVVFTDNRRQIANRGSSPFQAIVRIVAGVHVVRARVTFTNGAAPVTLTMRFRTCAPRVVRPSIGPPAFTG